MVDGGFQINKTRYAVAVALEINFMQLNEYMGPIESSYFKSPLMDFMHIDLCPILKLLV